MFSSAKNYGLFWLAVLLTFITFFVFYLDLSSGKEELTFAMLDVGQGDAIFIQSPTGTQILVDGGPPRKILGQLAKVMPIFDRSIDAIIITNPDRDHIGGFLDVLRRYKVKNVFEPGTNNPESTIYRDLKNKIQEKKIPNTLARKGMRLDIGGGAYIDILFPDRDVSLWGTNEGSVVARLSYGENSIILTGDTVAETEEIILSQNPGEILDSDILKVAHHGSKTSSSQQFVRAVSPEYALISSGKGNSYGHPHPSVLETLNSFSVKILRTDELGTIKFKCAKMGACEIKK